MHTNPQSEVVGIDDTRAKGPFHVRAIMLPDGAEPQDWWIADGRRRDTAVPEAVDLPGRWLLPGGLVDAHVHLTMNFGRVMPFADGSDGLMRANAGAQLKRGVLALRDAGGAWGGVPEETAEGPRLQRAGSLMAPEGRGYPNVCRAVAPDALVDAALEELGQGAQWIKFIGDFPGPDGDFFSAPPTYPLEVLEHAVRAVHAAGGRVMAHSTGRGAADLVAAGVDSIEHGMVLNEDLLRRMADQGTAWTLTMGTAMKHVGALAAQSTPVGAYIRGNLDRLRELVPMAVSLGVPVLAGTDEIGMGELWKELTWLTEFGLSTTDALRIASVAARDPLGFATVDDERAVNFVTYEADPRANLEVLKTPAAIVYRGSRVL